MQEDYEIIVIVSLYHYCFSVKIAPKMQEIAFLSLRKSNTHWGSMPRLGKSKIPVTGLLVVWWSPRLPFKGHKAFNPWSDLCLRA
jgi:hypothetical protein